MAYPRLLLALLAILLSVAAPGVATAGSFLSEYEDLPLAPGLTEAAGGMVFEAPSGRIVDAVAEAEAGTTGQQVLAFYAQTLPQLGWEKTGEASYRRDNEILSIEVDAKRHPLTIRFSVVPQ